MPCHPLRWILLSLGSLLPATPSRAQFELTDYRIAGFVGPAFFTNASPRPLLLGLSLDAGFFHPKSANVGVGFLVEGGLFHPALSGTANYYFSADAMLARDAPEGADVKLRPFGVAGYSHLFNATSNSISTANAFFFPASNFSVTNPKPKII